MNKLFLVATREENLCFPLTYVGEEENTNYLTPNNDYENVIQVIKLMKIASYLTQNWQKHKTHGRNNNNNLTSFPKELVHTHRVITKYE